MKSCFPKNKQSIVVQWNTVRICNCRRGCGLDKKEYFEYSHKKWTLEFINERLNYWRKKLSLPETFLGKEDLQKAKEYLECLKQNCKTSMDYNDLFDSLAKIESFRMILPSRKEELTLNQIDNLLFQLEWRLDIKTHDISALFFVHKELRLIPEENVDSISSREFEVLMHITDVFPDMDLRKLSNILRRPNEFIFSPYSCSSFINGKMKKVRNFFDKFKVKNKAMSESFETKKNSNEDYSEIKYQKDNLKISQSADSSGDYKTYQNQLIFEHQNKKMVMGKYNPCYSFKSCERKR